MTEENGKSPKYPCVKCGYCCRKTVCPFGVWDNENQRCVFLTENNLCSQYDKIKKRPDASISPAFGTGCSSPMFNDVRNKKIRDEICDKCEFLHIDNISGQCMGTHEQQEKCDIVRKILKDQLEENNGTTNMDSPVQYRK